jgi:hypothetical protein
MIASLTATDNSRAAKTSEVLTRFTSWLDSYGETSWDHQSFFAGPIGGRAKKLYYHHRLLGTAAVAPIIFFEAFVPEARRLFHHRERFPIADAHYAMGFAFLHQTTGQPKNLERAIHFLRQLQNGRSPGYNDYCWGYPSDWVTRNGMIKAQTPFITSTPYGWEAFLQVHQIEPREEWMDVLQSIARHAANDIKDYQTSEKASSCAYSPLGESGVINAAAYRSFLLTSASQVLENENYWTTAERNLNFVLENQNADGSWFYAVDGVRDFVDHYHTCFVMKALAKMHSLLQKAEGRGQRTDGRVQTEPPHVSSGAMGGEIIAGRIYSALSRGVDYYLNNLFAEDGMPKPFAKAPRLTVYKRELYDLAECINLCLLLRDRFPDLQTTLETVVGGILRDWIKSDGSFRSRRLHFGWDNVPMHRWGQAQMFRSLAFYLCEETVGSRAKHALGSRRGNSLTAAAQE